MRGEFRGTWKQLWQDVWLPLMRVGSESAELPSRIYSEIHFALNPAPSPRGSARELGEAYKLQARKERRLAQAANDSMIAKRVLRSLNANDFVNEQLLIRSLERFHLVLREEYTDTQLADSYAALMRKFLLERNLRYILESPFSISMTLEGLYSSLFGRLRDTYENDEHILLLLKEFDTAVHGLKHIRSEGHLKTCIQKQFNLLEALGQTSPSVTGNTFGAICNQVDAWPHELVRVAVKSLWDFANQFPGIRHGGNRQPDRKDFEIRDGIATMLMISGIVPYLAADLEVDALLIQP